MWLSSVPRRLSKQIHFSSNNLAQCKRQMRIYTKTGDKGSTTLYIGPQRIPKHSLVFEALGTIDELSSSIGLAGEYIPQSGSSSMAELKSQLQHIQSRLQDINSHLATPPPPTKNKDGEDEHDEEELKKLIERVEKTRFDTEGKETKQLEEWIDNMSALLPPLTSFILPSGGKASAHLHVCRTLCRRAERRVVSLIHSPPPSDKVTEKGSNIESDISEKLKSSPVTLAAGDEKCMVYLNRLSDYLFTAARQCAHHDGRPEVIYRKSQK